MNMKQSEAKLTLDNETGDIIEAFVAEVYRTSLTNLVESMAISHKHVRDADTILVYSTSMATLALRSYALALHVRFGLEEAEILETINNLMTDQFLPGLQEQLNEFDREGAESNGVH